MQHIVSEYAKSVIETGVGLIHEWQHDIAKERASDYKILLDLSDVAYWQLIAIRDSLYVFMDILYQSDVSDTVYLIRDAIESIQRHIALVWSFEMGLYV